MKYLPNSGGKPLNIFSRKKHFSICVGDTIRPLFLLMRNFGSEN